MQEALNLLLQVAVPCYPLLFLKMGNEHWSPVGSEMLYSLVKGKSGAAVVVCDAEGNSKAITSWVSEGKAQEFAEALHSRGLAKFDGEVRLPV